MAPEIKDFLAQARPTELLLLVAGTTPPLRQQLRLTFLDLLRQQVLALENRLIQSQPGDANTQASYVCPGPALHAYQPRAYELLLLRPFLQQNLPDLLLKHFVKLVFQAAESSQRFSGIVLMQEPLHSWHSQTWWQRLLGIRQLTPAGTFMRAQVTEWLVHQDMTLNRLAQRDTQAAATQAAQLGGALFLLPTFRSPLGHLLDQELFRAQLAQERGALTADSFGGDDASGPSSWHECGHHFDSHAEGTDNNDSSGSGCGSDSGCGGDSGCSGCGSGCGGD